MADQEKTPTPEAAAAAAKASGKKKKLMLIGGGGVAVVATAFVLAFMAVPKPVLEHELHGPFVAPMFAAELRVNLEEESRKRFAVLALNVVYDTYEEAYYESRSADPLYNAEIKDAVLGIASTKKGTEIVDKAEKPVFLEEVRQAVEPLLFPVHLGVVKGGDHGPASGDHDKASGLALGAKPSTFRGRFFDHVVKLDAVAKKISVDGGPEVTYQGDETDLEVPTPDGELIYFDVTGVEPEFQGEMHIGVKGRIRRILWENVLIA